jgi:hypothetical protein
MSDMVAIVSRAGMYKLECARGRKLQARIAMTPVQRPSADWPMSDVGSQKKLSHGGEAHAWNRWLVVYIAVRLVIVAL